jgi:hypothetical protein
MPLEAAVLTKDMLAPQHAPKKTSKLKATGNGEDKVEHKVVKPPESAQLGEWLSSQLIRGWAAVQPPLAGVDLRPYLFVAKDRKDYFGAASVLGHLATVAEQLLGPKIMVQSLEPDLKRLAPPEAAQVFEVVRGRIMGGAAFDKEPPGASGLAILVKAHPSLQSNLLDFLESLPIDRLGPWAVKGWESVIKDPEFVARFESLLGTWTSAKSQFLRAAADAALRTRKGGR